MLFSVTLLLYQTLTNQLEISSVTFKLKKKQPCLKYSSCSKKRREVLKYIIFLFLKARQWSALLRTPAVQLSNPRVRLRGGQGFAILPLLGQSMSCWQTALCRPGALPTGSSRFCLHLSDKSLLGHEWASFPLSVKALRVGRNHPFGVISNRMLGNGGLAALTTSAEHTPM